MGVPQQDVLEGRLPLVGYVPYRPLGQSHYVPAPWQQTPETGYMPAVMSEDALRKGIEKSMEPLPPQISEERLSKIRSYLELKYGPIWAGDNFMSYEEAVSRLNLDKSPGFPYYYCCEDKGCALTCNGHQIKQAVEDVIGGKEVWLPSTLTLKDELRTADRVKEGKTRVFSAGNIVALIVAKMLFDRQNDKLRKTLGQHPLTIGISVPGPQFVQTVLSVSSQCNCYGSDASGCDQRFYLPIARVIRDVRAAHLPPWLYEAVCLSYDQDFAGDVVVCGCVYKMFHNKSGRNNTGDDNGLLLDAARADYVMESTGCSPEEVDDYSNALFNGDDGDTAWWGDLSGPGWVAHCKQFNLQLELEDHEPRYACDVTFLSHHLIERFVPGLGDVMIAAGNKEKLLSSVEWIRRNKDFSLEENALTHLLGLRICLWPWRAHFLDIEALIDRYVDSIERSPRINDILRARIPEAHILNLHLRLESNVSFFARLRETLQQCGVRDLIISAIFESGSPTQRLQMQPSTRGKQKQNNGEKKVPRDELERRARQSARDKAAARKGTAQFTLRNLPQRSSYSREVLEVIGALIDPDNFRPFRLPDGGRKTFVNSLRDVEALADNGTDSSTLVPSSGFGVLRRDPRCALIVSKGARSTSQYQVIFPNGSNVLVNGVGAGAPIPIQSFKWVAGTDKRHGDFMCPWQFNDGRQRGWLQSPVANPARVIITGLSASTAYTLTCNGLVGKQVTVDGITATSSPGGVATFLFSSLGVSRQGYYAFSLSASIPAGGTVTIEDNSPTGVCHLAAPGFWDTIGDIDSIRVNSMSLMLSDRTNMLNTQGDVVAYQSSGGVTWDELIGMQTAGANLDPYSAITSYTKLCYKGEYKKGRYLPAKSSADARETVFIELGDSSNPWDIPPIIVADQLNFLYIGFNSHLAGASSLIGEWTAVMHVEGESESQWRDSQAPRMHPDSLKEAKHLLSDKEYDFENPSHLSKIWGFIKDIGKAILPAAQMMIPALPPQFQAPAYLGSQFAGALFNS